MVTERTFATGAERLTRRGLLLGAALLPLSGCGIAGRRVAASGPGRGRGHLVTKGTDLWVIDAGTGEVTSLPAKGSTSDQGVGVSRNGYIADQWDYYGSGPWQISISTLLGEVKAEYSIGGELSFPTSAAVLNADATRMAYSVNEPASGADSTRVDRTYVTDLTSGAVIGQLDGMSTPVFVDTGKLLVSDQARTVHVVDSALAELQTLPITSSPQSGAYSASMDGRFIAYETGSAIAVLDRRDGTTWDAVTAASLSIYGPVFSPDGTRLAFLLESGPALYWLHVAPFEPGQTVTVEEYGPTEVQKKRDGEPMSGTKRVGWTRV